MYIFALAIRIKLGSDWLKQQLIIRNRGCILGEFCMRKCFGGLDVNWGFSLKIEEINQGKGKKKKKKKSNSQAEMERTCPNFH